MKLRILGVLCATGLLMLAGCGDFDDDVRPATLTPTPTETPLPPPPTITNTPGPTATPTDTPSGPTPTPTETPEPGLGVRAFSIAQMTSDAGTRTGLFLSPLGNVAVLPLGVSDSVLLLEAGALNAEGVAPLRLVEDVLITIKPVADFLCLRLRAEDSVGLIACDGGVPVDVEVSSPSGPDQPRTVRSGLGTDGGPGAVELALTWEELRLPDGATREDCLKPENQELYKVDRTVYTTGLATAIKGTVTGSLEGENFDCAAWETENGRGMFVQAIPDFDVRFDFPPEPGNVASVLRLADSQTPP